MAAYLLADVLAEDQEAYLESGYMEAAVRTAMTHGGVYRARGGGMKVLEGDWQPDRIVLIEFPSMDDLLAWYHSDEYQEWVPVRQALAAHSKLVAVEGL